MNADTIDEELLYPESMRNLLLESGLIRVDLTIEEFYLAENYLQRYSRLSTHDCVALASAKTSKIKLLTSDGPLRKAAASENVNVLGTLGILDMLVEDQFITIRQYKDY